MFRLADYYDTGGRVNSSGTPSGGIRMRDGALLRNDSGERDKLEWSARRSIHLCKIFSLRVQSFQSRVVVLEAIGVTRLSAFAAGLCCQ